MAKGYSVLVREELNGDDELYYQVFLVVDGIPEDQPLWDDFGFEDAMNFAYQRGTTITFIPHISRL